MVLKILNLEGQLNCMIASKVTTILSTFFYQRFLDSESVFLSNLISDTLTIEYSYVKI